ncbi:MAG: hypothetical protein OEU76_00510, partial [Cyclobacteriaceae bacterium]|nr:hypothetical protein [Cyclobacteriaceae bacterium]
MKKGIKIIGIAIIILGLLFGALFLMITHDEFVTIILGIVNLPEEKREELSEILTIRIFNGIRFIPLLISVCGIFIFLFSSQINSTVTSAKDWCYSVFAGLNKLPRSYLLFGVGIMVLSFLFNLYNVVNMPIFFDEVLTYQHFTKRSIFTSISHYPAPNNHILHSALTNITHYFPFSRTINLRLPSLMVSLFSSLCFFYTFSKLLNVKIAVYLLSIYCFLFPVAYYGYLSRGYALVLLAFIICFYSTMQLIISREEKSSFKKYLVLLSTGSVIGFYAMPSFLYPYFAVSSFLSFYLILNKEVNKFLLFLVSVAITILIVIVLYLPIFLISGISAVANNEYVEPISRLEVIDQLIPHFSETSNFLFSIPLLGLLFVLVILSSIFFVKRLKSGIFPVYCILSAPIILLLHSVIPFPRTWVFLIIPFLFIIGLFAHEVN